MKRFLHNLALVLVNVFIVILFGLSLFMVLKDGTTVAQGNFYSATCWVLVGLEFVALLVSYDSWERKK